MTVLPVIPTAPALDRAVHTVAIPRQSRGAHRAAPSPVRPSERSRVSVAQHERRTGMSPALRGAGAAAYTVVARTGSLVTLAAMLVLGGAVAGATDGPTPDVSAPVTLQTP